VFSLSFHVEPAEIHEIYRRMRAMGVDCYHPPAVSVLPDYGPVTMFMCEDPDGIQIEFINTPTREQILEFRAGDAGAAGAVS
jgi:catechol 2,3-dioxygenase-like lactoylglutathione lyase family enzyme